MTVLVTGGAGFIGSNFIFYTLDAHPGDRVVCLDALTYAGNLSTLEGVLRRPNFRFVRGDIRDRDAVGKLFREEQPDYVVNFAAESHVDRSIENPGLFLETNLNGTAVLMDAALRCGVKRFHQVSTDEVYGDLPLNRPDLLFTEESPLRPSSPYSASKASADLLAGAYGRTYGLPVSISRCSNNYGPWQFPEKLIPLMCVNCFRNRPLPVYGEGKNVRDWLYVEDHCRAIDAILRRGEPGKTYNIGGNTEKSNLDVVRTVCREAGASESLIAHVPDRKGHDLRYAIDASKLRRELGWTPQTPFGEGIRRTVAWYREHAAWWEAVVSGEYRDYYRRHYGEL